VAFGPEYRDIYYTARSARLHGDVGSTAWRGLLADGDRSAAAHAACRDLLDYGDRNTATNAACREMFTAAM